jgi:RHS repeat-associated protein
LKYSYIFLYPVYNKLTISGTNPGIGAVTSLSLKENTNYTLNFELTYSSSPSDIMVTLKDQNQATIYSGNSTNGAGLNTLALNLGTFTNPLTLEITNNNNNQIFELDNITLTQDGIAGVSYYTAQLVSAQDYYPFGTTLPGRTFQDDRFSGYRFTFNGKEKDKEGMGGGGSTYDYGFRIYNAQIGKFLSVDPLTKSYPWYTPYQFAGNKPIENIDVDGKEEENYMLHLLKTYLGIGPKPSNAEEAYQQSNELDATNKVLNHIEKMGEAHNQVYGTLVPGYSAMLQYSKENYGQALFLGVFDIAGGRMIGGLFKGGSQLMMSTLFKSPVVLPKLFENASVKAFKFVKGNNSTKTAVIGQGMGRVETLASGLKNPEVFTPTKEALKEWNSLLAKNEGKQISDEVAKGTKIFKENETWIQGVKEKGYDIIDIGADGSGKSSTFYNMEQKIVYND